MLEVIGEVLPYAMTVAISPIPIIAVILMLMSPRPRTLGLGFLAGWLVGITLVIVVFVALAGVLEGPDTTDDPQLIASILQLLFGVLLLLLALKQWRSRPQAGQAPELPKWMQSINSFKIHGAFGLAALLSALNPKNLMIGAAAGLTIGQQLEGTTNLSLTVLIFTLLASSTVLISVGFYLVAPQKSKAALIRAREWLTLHNAAIMVVLFTVLGSQLLGKGLGVL